MGDGGDAVGEHVNTRDLVEKALLFNRETFYQDNSDNDFNVTVQQTSVVWSSKNV
jgi:hypothetical protein